MGEGGRLLDLQTKIAFFFEAGRGLSYSSWLTTCIQGLALRLVPSHNSATVLTLYRWRVAEFQKHTFRGEDYIDIAKNRWLGFRLKSGTCLLTMIKVSIMEGGRGVVTEK